MSFVSLLKGWSKQLNVILHQSSEVERKEIIKVIRLIEFKKIKRNAYKDHSLGEQQYKGWRDLHPLYELNPKKDLIIVYRYDGKWINFRFIGTHKDFYNK